MSFRAETIRLPGAALAGALALGLGLGLCACGGSSGQAAASAGTAHACAQVGAVLSDGPDPDADPAGYAEAQILPLRQISIPDPGLRTAVRQLDAAYQQVFASDGKSASATAAAATASKKVNSICPGAAS